MDGDKKRSKVDGVATGGSKGGGESIDSMKFRLNRVKNKQHRQDLFRKVKVAERKVKIARRKDPNRIKQEPITQEDKREKDATMLEEVDEEVEADVAAERLPIDTGESKVLITTSDRPSRHSAAFCKELCDIIPNAFYRYRRGLDLKKIIPTLESRGFRILIVLEENGGRPHGLVISYVTPDGPTLRFRLSSVIARNRIKRRVVSTQHYPELILRNFKTRLGATVAHLLRTLFPQSPQYTGRRVVTFANQRDYIFFRHHRYKFKTAEKVGIAEIGPRFTLKLRSIQKGTFDSKTGEYIWMHKRKEMDSSRLKWHL